MTTAEAPYSYIRDYYRNAHAKNERFPHITSFWLSALDQIRGRRVLNVGCGPQFYDYIGKFRSPPKEYVGLDINRNTFEFLRRSRDPRLLRAKARSRKLGARIELICADALDHAPELAGRFDSVVGVGFFGTFHGAHFDRLTRLMYQALDDQGSLLKITWHGPHRTPEEQAMKLKFRFDNPEEPGPEVLVSGFERAGFALRRQEILPCDPASYGWQAVQACLFAKL